LRAASILCDENTLFATLSKGDYENIIKESEFKKNNEKSIFFKKHLLHDLSLKAA